MAIRKRRGGWQVIVYAGLDPLTGKQRQRTRQVNGSYRQAGKVEARLRTEVADGQHAGTRVKTLGELLDLWIERRGLEARPQALDRVQLWCVGGCVSIGVWPLGAQVRRTLGVRLSADSSKKTR